MNYYKIAPGEKAQRWKDCYKHKVICMGWSKVGDLRKYKNQGELANKLERVYYRNRMSTASLAAKQLWALRGIKQGDIIIANRGKEKVLAIGEVPPKGAYRYDPRWSDSRDDDMPHIVPVVWGNCNQASIKEQTKWQVTIVKLEPILAEYIIRKMKVSLNINANHDLDCINDNDMDNYDKSLSGKRKKQLRLIEMRRGQPKFRKSLLKIYEGKCCLSGCAVTDVLEAAHIQPYGNDGMNDPRNGLLLRSDLHLLFDLHLLSIHPETYRIKIDASLIDTEYGVFNDKSLCLPTNQKYQKYWPSRKWLREREKL